MSTYWRKSSDPIGTGGRRLARTIIVAALLALVASATFIAAPNQAEAQPVPADPQSIVSEERIFPGDTNCDVPIGGTLTPEVAARSLPVTVCVYATNIGAATAPEVFVSSAFLDGEGDTFFNVERGETVVLYRFVTSLQGANQAARKFTAHLRDGTYVTPDQLTLELDQLVAADVITDVDYANYFARTDLPAIDATWTALGRTADAVIDIDLAAQQNKWQALGLDDYEFLYQPICFCFFPNGAEPPYRIRVIDGQIVEAVSVAGGSPAPAWTQRTLDELLDSVVAADISNAANVTAAFDLLYGYPTTGFIDRDLRIADEEIAWSVSGFTPLWFCAGQYWDIDEPCLGEPPMQPTIEVTFLIFTGNVPCEGNGLDPTTGDLSGQGRTTYCFTITNTGDVVAPNLTITTELLGVEVAVGDLLPGESFVHREYVDLSSETFLADLRGQFNDSDDLEREVDQLVNAGVISGEAAATWLEVTDIYELAGQDPAVPIEVAFDTQIDKWQALGIDDYEFVYRDTSGGVAYPSEVAPPWLVRVIDREVASAVSVTGGGTVDGTTLDAILEAVQTSDARNPFRLDASFDVVYGYPTNWNERNGPSFLPDGTAVQVLSEIGQAVTSFVPLKNCTGTFEPVGVPCSQGSERFIADLRGMFLDSDDLERELDQLVRAGAVSQRAADRYLALTDFYSLVGQDPTVEVDVDFGTQIRKWQALGIDDYEFVYQDSCFCFYAPGTEPPWKVQVEDGRVVNAVSVNGGGTVPGTTIESILGNIAAATNGDPYRLNGSFDVLYGYPTSWFIDGDVRIADDEFGQTIQDFTPLGECAGQLLPFDATCGGVSSDVLAYEGDTSCTAPGGPPIPDNVAIFSTIVTVCVTATNLGNTAVSNVTVTVENPPFEAELGDIAAGETVTKRFVIDRSIRDYTLETEQPGDADRIGQLLAGLLKAGSISAADLDQWRELAMLDASATGLDIFETQLKKWNALGLVDYEFTSQLFCFCPPETNAPIRVRVVNGEVVSATVLRTGEPAGAFVQAFTIPEVFERVTPDSSAFAISATFDRFYGLPAQWSIDSIQLAIDDELSGRISDFAPLVKCNGELVTLGSKCGPPTKPDCTRPAPGGECRPRNVTAGFTNLDRDWALAWGHKPN